MKQSQSFGTNQLRYHRIFQEDGKALVLAMDHGAGMGPVPGLAQPAATIQKAISGGVDAVLTTYGIAIRFPTLFRKTGLILRMDGGFTILSGGFESMDMVIEPSAALHLGADAVCCMGFVGGNAESRSLKYLHKLVQDCAPKGLPVMAEMLVMDPKGATTELLALAARTGVEAGADFIKTTFTGSAETFRPVVEGSFQPILVLGGSKINDLDLLNNVHQAMQAGAAGAVIGRNIWQHPEPEKIARALHLVVHMDKKPENALEQSGLEA